MASSVHGYSVSATGPATLVELLQERSTHEPDRLAYLYLDDGDEETRLTYRELDRQARAIAAWLQDSGTTGERALLLYPPGLAYIAAFFGCLYAGVVAVPAYPPRLNRPMPRLQAIVADARPAVALTTTSILANIERRFEHVPELKGLKWLNTDLLPGQIEAGWRRPGVGPDTLAFLQYTSGSTGTPKGVMLSHGNLMVNMAMIRHGFQIEPDERGVFWLPSYHDMGLIGSILEPMYAGGPTVLMSPASFLQRPARWLEAITKFRGTVTGAPNFAYDLCVQKITPEQRQTLDLSSWRLAFCGAEPVRRETLERFAETFAPCGFRRDAFYPCYGLAEASLLVAGGLGPAFPPTRRVQRRALEAGRLVESNADEPGTLTLVSCGGTLLDQKIVIVEPESRTVCAPGDVGEIWVSGGNVSQGYWNRPDETEATFQAYLAGTGEGPFFRTGDLGVLQQGQLFITGRLKDLIIIHGRNYYPQDIEQTVEASHPALRRSSGAAFSVEVEGAERLVVVYELERQRRNVDADEVVEAIRRAVAEEHELQIYAVVLVKTLSIPKTSSGKIQRFACRTGFLEGTLDVVAERRVETPTTEIASPGERSLPAVAGLPQPEDGTAASFPSAQVEAPSASAIESWLTTKISARLGVAPETIDHRQPFVYYGLDSVQAVSLAGELQAWLGRAVSPTLAWDYPTIESLSRYLAGEDGSTANGRQPTAYPERPSKDSGRRSDEPIAIIGLGCRFPGAPSPEAFWQLLRDGVDAIAEVPPDRWNVDALYDPDPAAPGKLNTRWGGFVEGIDRFDPSFFGISPREAARMDPQQRLLLEVAWEALENAGLAPHRLAGRPTGVFVGISSFDYSRYQFEDPARVDAYAGTGNAHSIAANRLSYLLDLRGPSVALDTACSSSLVAVHLACQSLRTGESELAIAGGVNVLLRPELTITFSQARMMAADGRCKTFDADADGYVRGEGCGVVILKRLSEALRDGDNVLAVIRGSAVNQDGRSNGLTAPNGPAQQAVIRQALANAGVAPTEIGYVEIHGTGTPLGDPIEFESLKAVLAPGRSADQLCALGSVKTNIGHLESAAGIAGLIKAVLVLRHGEIPPHLHLKKLNPHITLDGTPFVIPTAREAWPGDKTRRLASVSSFGFGGTNAHTVLEAFEKPDALGPNEVRYERPLHLLTLSAQSESALKELAGHYENRLAAEPGLSLADVCFTANVGRTPLPHRLAVLSDSEKALREKLAGYAAGQDVSGLFVGRSRSPKPPKVAFLFTGQGSQYLGMGRRLYETQPTFRAALDRCDEFLRPRLAQSLLSVLFASDGEASPLDQTAYTQPALFALEYALAELWRSWGIEPAAVLGHSVGEYVAACVAGAFTLEDGLALIAERGRLMQALPNGGAMAAIFADEPRVSTALGPYSGRVSIAALNGPESTVISGEAEAVHSILAQLEAEGIKAQPLTVSHAFHSPLMEPMLLDFERTASGVRFEPLRIPLISNLTGQAMRPGTLLDPGYWRRHVREAVRFAEGMQALAALGVEAFVEIGPHPVLLGMGRLCLPDGFGTWLLSLKRGQDDWRVLLGSVAELYVKGGEVDWPGFDSDYPRRKVPLPTYPFERERYWLGPAKSNGRMPAGAGLPEKDETEAAPDAETTRYDVSDWMYELRWLPKSRLDQVLIRRAPDYMPAPSALAEMLRPRVLELSTQPYVRVYQDLSRELDRLSTTFVLDALRKLGLDLRPGQRLSFKPLIEQLGISPQQHRLFHRFLEIMEEDGILTVIGADWEVRAVPEVGDTQAHLQRLLASYPAGEAELTLFGRTGPRLAEGLRGEVDPLQVLFPDGSLNSAEALYQDSISFRGYNQVVQEAIAAALAHRPEGRAVRILELGAGTGGTTAYVLPRLPADWTEYLLTDVSNLFLGKASQKFQTYPFLQARLLDIELEPEAQGLAPHQFDIVLAANVLHATRDLREALANVRRLLAPEGLLVLLETTAQRPQRWVDLVFGLTEGWWRFADLDVRPAYPLVTSATWRKLLAEAGFTEVAVLPEDVGRADLSQQVVILARGSEMEGSSSPAGAVIPSVLAASIPASTGTPDVPAERLREAPFGGTSRRPFTIQDSAGSWLIFADRQGVGEQLAQALQSQGEAAVLVSAGSSFEQLDPNRFRIHPAAGMARIFDEAFRGPGRRCRGIVHLWSLDAPAMEKISSKPSAAQRAAWEAVLRSSLGTVVELVQELNRDGGLEGLPLWLVTCGAQPVGQAGPPPAAVQAPLWGLGRVLAQEHPGAIVRMLDLDPCEPGRDAFVSIWEEIRSPGLDLDGENQVAFRRGQRYVPRLLRKHASEEMLPALRWRKDATYLITGGLGDLGLVVARWMAEQGARRIILLGRTRLPARSSWDRLNGNSALASKVAAIREIESLGVSIHLASVDVANERQLKSFLSKFRREGWPPIRGVLHLAGVVEDRTLLEMDWAAMETVLRPKLLGAWNLHRLLSGASPERSEGSEEPLDFFLMFSSAGTLLGQIGQGNYAAANAFLDALAHYRRAKGQPGLTINWGAWESLGFAAAEGGQRLTRRLALHGVQSLPPQAALDALDRLLADGSTQVAVIPVDWLEFRQYLPKAAGAEPALLERLVREATAAAERRAGAKGAPELTREAVVAAEAERRLPMLEAYLAGRVAKVLGLPASRLDLQQPLDSLGLDSLMAVEVKNRVEGDLGLSVPMVIFLQGPSIADLAVRVLDQLTSEAEHPAAPLVRVERGRAEYPLSYGQRSMWFLNQLAPESAAYNVVFPAHIRSSVDQAALRRAFQALLDRHPVLRTTLHVHAGQAVQVVHPHLPVYLVETDASAWTPAQVGEFLFQQVHMPFDLERGPIMRVNLLSRSPDEHILLFIVHHIAIDFWSLVGLMDELGRLYADPFGRAGQAASLPPLDYQVVDFAHWQSEMLAGPQGERLWAYWQEQLAGELPALNLPTDRPRPPVQTYEGNLIERTVPHELAQRLRTLAMAEGTTLNMLLVAAFQVLLYRYTDQTDILLGTLATGRSRAEFESIVGYFVNPVVLRANLSGNPSFRTFLAQVRQTVLAALEHEDAPFPLLVERLQPARDASRTLLFQVMFIMLQPRHLEQQGVSQFFMGQSGARMNLGGLDLESFSLEQRTAMFDLTLTMVDAGGALSAHWNYNGDLFDAETIARMATHFECLLESTVARPGASVLELPILAADERRLLLEGWNDTRKDFPLDRTFVDLFQEQAARSPNAVATIFKGEALTYEALNRRANRLAHFLVQQGVGTDVVVALLAERSNHFLVAMLAVFKAGGGYLPLDPLHPPARHAQILGQSQSPLILTTREFMPGLAQALEGRSAESQPAVWDMESVLEVGGPDEDLPVRSSPTDLAYVIFTSGSTGLPKGAMVEQRGMLNHLFAKIDELRLSGDDVVAETASQCFDISVWQFLAALLVGGRVHIFEDEIAHDPAQLLESCGRGRITILETVPSLLRAMLETLARDMTVHSGFATLRWMIPTGEALPPELARQWLDLFPGIPLLNAYGPTECSDDVAHFPIHEPPAPYVARMPIGRPIPNMRLYVLDSRLQPAPIGVAGELCVGGIGVGRGYLNDPVRTAEAFLPDPFSAPGRPGGRLYKTGDLARWLPDGALEFLGRIDHQVKIRGFRIELGEIEAVLSQHPAVRDKVVVAREDNPAAPWDKRLVAYLVLHPEATCTVNELRGFLKQQLPEYMLPSAFVFLDALPLTPNGKIDRRALPAPEGGQAEVERAYVGPRTPVEAALAELWASVLNVERVGIYDNFFELGGDSILALQAISRATESGLRFTPKQLLQCQTIAELAAVANTAPIVQAEQGLITGPVPLTPIQRWFFERSERSERALPEPRHYNQALLLQVHRPLDPTILESAMQQLVRHHDALRLRFSRGEGGWQQVSAEPDDHPLVTKVNLSGLADSELERAIESTAAEAQASLELTAGPLIRAILFDLGTNRPGRLFLVAHHLIVDGMSWRILLGDLYAGYLQFSQGQVIQLPPKTSAYRDWAHKLVEYGQSSALREELDFWVGQASDPVAPLPVDYSSDRRENLEADACTVWSGLSPEDTRRLLQDAPQAYNTQIGDLLLTALAMAFRRWTGSPSLLIDLEGHGREELFEGVDLSRTVGWFTSLFPVRLGLEEIPSPGEAIKSVKEQLRRIPNRGIGYGVLRYLSGDGGIVDRLQALPRAEVSFNYLGQLDLALPSEAPFSPASEPIGRLYSPKGQRAYRLDVTASVVEGRLQVAWTFGEYLHRHETVEALAAHYAEALREVIAHCLSPEAGGYTPSDFPEAQLSQVELDRVLAGMEFEDEDSE